MTTEPERSVTLLSLGGTIAMTQQASGGIAPTLDAASLLAAVPSLTEVCRVSAHTFRSIPGAHLWLEDLVALADEIRRLVQDGADGVVVTQGTDTLEETAYALDLLLDLDAPVVVTGAMRPPGALGADGPANIDAAARVAADPAAHGRGVLVVLNEQIHTARHVTKTHTSRPDAFASPEAGSTGAVVEGRVHWYWAASRSVTIDSPRVPVPFVPLVPTWLGDEGLLLRATLELNPAGLVIDALGAGHVPAALVEPLEQAARTRPVLLCSRVRNGHTYRHTYGFLGSETDLLGRGLIWAADLPGVKARIHLALAAAAGWSRDRIAASMHATGGVM